MLSIQVEIVEPLPNWQKMFALLSLFSFLTVVYYVRCKASMHTSGCAINTPQNCFTTLKVSSYMYTCISFQSALPPEENISSS